MKVSQKETNDSIILKKRMIYDKSVLYIDIWNINYFVTIIEEATL